MDGEGKALEQAHATDVMKSNVSLSTCESRGQNPIRKGINCVQFTGQSDGSKSPHVCKNSTDNSFLNVDVACETVVNAGFDEHPGVDLSHLPEVVWLMVLGMIDVRDRLHVSQTCKRMLKIVGQSSLWKSVVLDLSHVHVTDFHDRGYLLPWQKDIVKHFGHLFQHVEVSTTYFDLRPDAYSILVSLGEKDNIKSLTIKSVNDNRIFDYHKTDIANPNLSDLMDELCEQLPGLVHLDVEIAFENPIYPERLDQSPVTDMRYKYLRSLKMASDDIPEMNDKWHDPIQSYITPTAVLICKFVSLQHLHLRVFNVSNCLLKILSDKSTRQCPLLTLMIEFDAEFNEEEEPLPNLSSEAWKELISVSPDLEVSCKIRTVISWNIKAIFKPEVPLVSVSISCECEDGVPVASFLCRQHALSLRYFEYDVDDLFGLSNTAGLDTLPLVKLVTGCPNLQYLVYKANIHYEDILKLAMLNRKWKEFQFHENRILTDCKPVAQILDCEKAERRTSLDELSCQVSKLLGYQWVPLMAEPNAY